MSNIPARIFRLASERGDGLAFRMQREDGSYRNITWREYRDRSLRFASYLRAQGVSKGDRVLLLSENCPEWTMAALATMSLGATLVPVASMASAVELENIIKGSQPKFSIISSRASCVKNLNGGAIGKFLYWDSQSNHPLQDICRQYKPDAYDPSLCEQDSVAVLIFTSGTTGQPKAVPLSHKNILTNAEDVLIALVASNKDRCVSVLPLSHMFEFTGGFLVAAIVGASVTYIKSLRADDLIKAMKDNKATILLGVPLLFEVMARNLEAKLQSMPLWLKKVFDSLAVLVRKNGALGPIFFFPIHRAMGGNIRYFMAGGSRLQPGVYEFFRGIGIQVLQGYGLTETSPVLSVTTLATAGADHVGRALKTVDLGVFSDEGLKCEPGSEGEICARGPSVFKGYLDPAHNKDIFRDDWFKTGDLGFIDQNGLLRITGRKKDLIVTGGGKNVYPEEIESTLIATGYFVEVAALGIQGEDGHEKVCVAVVPDRAKFALNLSASSKEDVVAAAEKLVVESCKILSDYKWPQRVEIFFEELPKTITRKIKKHEVRALIKKRTDLGESATGKGKSSSDAFLKMDDDLERTIAEGIAGISRLPQQEILRSASLSRDLSLDSLLIVEVIGAVERKFDHQFEGLDFTNVDTVADLVAVLGESLGDKRKKNKRRVRLAEFKPWDNFRKRWRWPRTMINSLLRAWLRGYYWMKIEGLENLEDPNESYVFVPNHSSHFDTLAIVAAVPLRLVHATFPVAAKDYFFSAWWKAIIARVLINAIPFDRKARVDEGMQKCMDILAQRGSLVIFPEGTRSPDGRLQEFKPGVGQLLAAQKHVKAIPTYIEGAHDILPKGRGIPRISGKLIIRFGKPVSFEEYVPSKESYRAIAKELQGHVEALSKG